MKRFGLAPVTLFSLTLTGLLLPYSGWFAGRGSARTSAAEVRATSRNRDLTEAAVRFRSGQPSHWRAYVLHH